MIVFEMEDFLIEKKAVGGMSIQTGKRVKQKHKD